MNLDPFNRHTCEEIEELLIKAKLPELLMLDQTCKSELPDNVSIICDDKNKYQSQVLATDTILNDNSYMATETTKMLQCNRIGFMIYV